MIRKPYDKDGYGVIYTENGASIVPVLTARRLMTTRWNDVGLRVKWDIPALKKIKHLKIGGFESHQQAMNAVRYTKTKFFRFILTMMRLAQFDIFADNSFRPAQNTSNLKLTFGEWFFTEESIIDWTQDLDPQLYRLFNFDAPQINWIEENFEEEKL